MKSKNNQKGFLTVLGTVALVVVIVGSVASVSTAVNNNNAESVETPSLTVEQSK
jgi:glucose uptake protein GlcU